VFGALRARLAAVIADAGLSLDRLGLARTISEARTREETEQFREALIGSVSHELRTPLSSILGASTVLSLAPEITGSARLKKLAALIHQESERLNVEIQNILDASRISSNGLQANRMGRTGRLHQCGASALPQPPDEPSRRGDAFRGTCSVEDRFGANGARAGTTSRQRGEIFAAKVRHQRPRA